MLFRSYQELLADGLYGELSDRQREPVDRIQYAAQQILSLIDGLQELAASSDPADDERVDTDTRTVLTQLQQRLRPMADARGVSLDGAGSPAQPLPQFPLARFLRATEIALIAVIKNAHGKPLQLDCSLRDDMAVCSASNCDLDPERDHPRHFNLESPGRTPPTPAQLRLAMASATLSTAGGTLRLLPEPTGCMLELTLPVTPLAD